MKTLIAFFVITLVMMFGGYHMQDSVSAYSEKRTRAITMVDAYEKYDEYGNRSYRGVFVDNKLRFEFEYGLEWQHYNKFVNNRVATQMEVTTSLNSIAPSKYNRSGTTMVGWMLFWLGLVGFVINSLATVCHVADERDKKREAIRRAELEKRWSW